MSTFTETAHPRANDGRFTVKALSEASGGVDTDLTDPFLSADPVRAQQRRAAAIRAGERAERDRCTALIQAASQGDTEVADRILQYMEPARRQQVCAQIAQANERATWLEDDPSEHAYIAAAMPDGAQILAPVDAEDFRDFDGVDYAAYGQALTEAWEQHARALALDALRGGSVRGVEELFAD